eukprot:gene1413-32786_t
MPTAQGFMTLVSRNALEEMQHLHEECSTAEMDWCMGFRNTQGYTPLMIAAANNFVEVAKWLVEKGAAVDYINIVSTSGGSALHEAVLHSNYEMVDALIKRTQIGGRFCAN